MKPIKIAYSLIGCFIIIERLLRKGEAAKSLQESHADRGSTRAIGAAFGLAMLALLIAPLLNWLKLGRMHSKTLAWGGIVTMVVGLMLRIWAFRILGSFYTRTLRTSPEQHLIEEGPYRLVRNPGYLADLLLWLGAGFASANWIVLATITFPMLQAYWNRIKAEEAMLAEAFPQDYDSYARRTWRLIPFLY
ncbi:MAG TPA: isoprenylcysteine carboxylmethyltransferase family protein [Ktedonobacteraceae bacterium]|nr:isoprenylcysteine carboxylmethyltransferase family protein [Ktedonobacteraceae bacterium]